MNESVWRFRVGVVVLVAGMIVVIMVLLFGAWPQFLKPQYSVKIKFPSAPGVAKNTPVRKNGVPIGRVSSVQLIDDGVVLTLAIDQNRRLRMNEFCRITTGSLVTGDAVLEFVRDDKFTDRSVIESGAYLPDHGQVSTDPMQVLMNLESGMQKAFTSIDEAGQSMNKLFAGLDVKLNGMVSDPQQVDRILAKAEQALNSFSNTMESVGQLVDNPEMRQKLDNALAALPRVLEEMPGLFQDARTVLTEARGAVVEFRSVGERAQRIGANLEQLTEPLADRGPQFAQNLENAIVNVDRALTQLVEIGEQIKQGRGAIGRLVYEEELYDRVEQTLWNVEDFTKRLQPIVRDVRVLTDKVSRDPSVVVRGAIRNRGGGLKTGMTQ